VEEAFLKFVAEQSQRLPSASLGIGDDAAILSLNQSTQLVVCTDLISDDVDFLLSEVTPQQIGRKAMAVNLSDIAAMASRPIGALLTLLLPSGQDSQDLAEGIFRGAAAIGKMFDCPIIGGDTNTWPGKVAVSVTVLGKCLFDRPLTRAGAVPGDRIFVTGELGGTILGHHLSFTPRIEEAIQLKTHYQLHAGMDLSDGLSRDLTRLCEQSGVGAQIDTRKLPLREDAKKLSETSGKSPWWHALHDGEDFEIIFTVSESEANRLSSDWSASVPVTEIGQITTERQLQIIDERGNPLPLEVEGFSHG